MNIINVNNKKSSRKISLPVFNIIFIIIFVFMLIILVINFIIFLLLFILNIFEYNIVVLQYISRKITSYVYDIDHSKLQ